MEDATSLILQLKNSGGVNVDISPIEAILLSFLQTLKHHEVLISKLPKLETEQYDLRKDLNRLLVAVESVQSAEIDNHIGHKKRYELPERSDSSNEAFYGVRRADFAPIHSQRAEDLAIASDASYSKSLREIKKSILKLQRESDEGIANSMSIDETIKSLKDDLMHLHQKITSTATVSQIQTIQRTLASNQDEIEQFLNTFKITFREELDGRIDQNLSDLKTWFTDLEGLLKQRQAKLESRVASCAREYDVSAFQESIESEVKALEMKASFLDNTAKAQGKTIVMLQQKHAFALFRRHYVNWKRNSLKRGLSQWKTTVQQQIRYTEGKAAQKRVTRKVLTQIMSRRKKCGLDKWVKFRDWHRKAEQKKLKASTLIYERLGLYFFAPLTTAFNKWRRMTMTDKMKLNYDYERMDESDNDMDQATGALRSSDRLRSKYELTNILDFFKDDAHGATYVLAQEIENIKSYDIADLRREFSDENKKMISNMTFTLKGSIESIEDNADKFKKCINERVDNYAIEFPSIHAQLRELSNASNSSKVYMKNYEESQEKTRATVFEHIGKLDQRLFELEEISKSNSNQISQILKEQADIKKSIPNLYEMIRDNEQKLQEQTQALKVNLATFGDELLKTKVTLGQTQARCDSLEKELNITKSELLHFQDACQSENEKMQACIYHPGMEKPSLKRIVKVGYAYENLAKEKNYVMGIHVMAVMISMSTFPMKSKAQKTKVEEVVDVPAEIAAFAHDYAAWIAYQADHESLIRLIAGTNPEEQVYAEEDISSRRRELLEGIKSELGEELEKVPCTGEYDSTFSPSRGSGLRWEARAIFLARVADAIDVALSTHDQILLPASTRLGRIRPSTAAVTVCVACDRPMRRKGRYASIDGNDVKEGSGKSAGRPSSTSAFGALHREPISKNTQQCLTAGLSEPLKGGRATPPNGLNETFA